MSLQKVKSHKFRLDSEILSHIWKENVNSTDLLNNETLYRTSAESNCEENIQAQKTYTHNGASIYNSENLHMRTMKQQKSKQNEASDCSEHEIVGQNHAAVIVTGLPRDSTKGSLWLHFESFGDIVDITITPLPTNALAVIIFVNNESVEKILNSEEPLKFRGCLLTILRDGENSATKENKHEPNYFAIKVTNLPKEILYKEVYNIFSKYGEIADPPNIYLNEPAHEALIPYVFSTDAERLLEETKGNLLIRSDTVNIYLEKAFGKFFYPEETQKIAVESKETDNNETVENVVEALLQNIAIESPKRRLNVNNKQPSALIQIRNINKLSSEDTLLRYLTNTRSGSDGGAIKYSEFRLSFDQAIVEFVNIISAEGVLRKQLTDTHTLDNQTIYISRLPPTCENRIFLQNIPQWISKHDLMLYLESKAHEDVKNVSFNDGGDGAIVTFADAIDIKKMASAFTQKPFKNGRNQVQPGELQIVHVAYPDALLVYCNVSGRDSIVLALEDYVSKINSNVNHSVCYAMYKPEKEMWLVCFEEYEAVALFPHNFEVSIDNKKYHVAPYFDCLGWRRIDGEEEADFLREYGSETVHQTLPKLEAQFLTSDVGNTYIKCEVQKKYGKGVVKIKSDAVEVTAESIEKSQNILQFLLSCIKTLTIKLDIEMLTAWNEKAENFLAGNKKATIDSYFTWALSDYDLCFTAASPKAESIKSIISVFLDDHSIYEQTVVKAGIEGLYIKKFHEAAIMYKPNSAGSITLHKNGAIRMKGTKSQLGLFDAEIKVILTNIEVSEYVVSGPGMPNFFQNQTGFTDIAAITEHTKTLIISDSDLIRETIQLDYDEVAHDTTGKECEFEGFINGKIKIIVRNGDILEENVDAIVNAANENLQNSAGLAGTIIDKGGMYIQSECDKFIKKNGPLNVAGIFVSSGGKLLCDKIIHAVGPRYKDGNSNEGKELRNTINNIIQTAQSQGFSSIAIPAISTCIFDYPVDEAIPIIVNTIVLSSAEVDVLKEIRFVDRNAVTVKKFVDEIKKCNKFKKTRDAASTLSSIINKVPVSERRRSSEHLVEKIELKKNSMPISLIKDDIVNVAKNCDVIVNTTGSGPNDMFSNGNACKAIAAAGGQAYVNNIKKRYPNGIGTARLAVTESGNLGCKQVYHISCSKWNPQYSLQELTEKITGCLDEAEKQKMSNIAFPAIGTGILGYPASVVANAMYDSVAAWLSTHPKCHLKGIIFVIFPSDTQTVNAFENEFANKNETKVPSQTPLFSTRNSSSVINGNQGPLLASDKQINVPNSPPIKLIKDNIVNVAKTCDVIVNTTGSGADSMFSNGNACKAIAAAAGQAYIDDIKTRYPDGIGNLPLAITLAGSLGCKQVYHISCSQWNPQSSVSDLEGKVVLCLDEAEKQKLSSIAFPAIGTGMLNYPADIVAKSMYNSATAWLNGHPNCHLKSVTFVVFPSDTNTVAAFEQEFSNKNIKIQTQTVQPLQSSMQNVPPSTATAAVNIALFSGIKIELVQHMELNSNICCIITSLGDMDINYVSGRAIFQLSKPNGDLDKWQTALEQSLANAAKTFTSVLVAVFETGVDNQVVVEKVLNAIKTHATEKVGKLTHIQILAPTHADLNLMTTYLTELVSQGKKKTWFRKTFDYFWHFGNNDDSLSGQTGPVLSGVQEEMPEQNLKLHICGLKSDVRQALLMLDKLCQEKCPERIIIKPIIQELDDEAIEKFREGAEHYNVYVHVNRKEGKIKIKGYRAIEYREKLAEVLDNLSQEYDRQLPKEHVEYTNVEWFKRQNTGQSWQLIQDGGKLEAEHKRVNGKGTVLYNLDGNPDSVTVDFDKMTILAEGTVSFHLKRRDITDLIPVEWSYNGRQNSNQEYELIMLDSNSKEYCEIQTAVSKTAPAGTQIVQIERVENPVRFSQYETLKRKLQHSLPPNIVAESKLFHGTDQTNVPSVCISGFDRGLAGTHKGTIWGCGSYFARDFKYSMDYTQTKTMFYAFVLTGQYTLGDRTMRTAPVLNAAKGTKYDSVVDDVANPSIFVVFTDNHAYPAYLITYA